MSENEATSDQDDVSFIRTDDMVCLQCSETGERVCLAAEGFGNRHCFLEPIANKNYPPEMPSCVFVIEQALSVRALQEMVTAESSDLKPGGGGGAGSGGGAGVSDQEQALDSGGNDDADSSSADAQAQLSAIQLTSNKGGGAAGGGGDSGGLGGGNRTLLYGHAVLLRHFHSGMYLATLPICSSSDKLAFDVGLKDVDEIGESCWWTVHPGSKQRSEGEKVRFGDDLILVSVATERYLHFTTSEEPLVAPMASASAAAVTNTLPGKQAIVNASFHSTHWSIAPFGTGLSRMKNVGYVFGGQVLRLLHGGDECLTISMQQQSGGGGGGGGGAAGSGSGAINEQQQQQQQQSMTLSNESSSNVPSAGGGGGGNTRQVQSQSQPQQPVDVIYEGGAVMNQARSLWRLDLIRTKWSGGFVQYSNGLRIRHITTGKYLGVNESNHLCLLAKIDATVERTAFCLRLNKDDSKSGKGSDGSDDKDEEVIGSPMIKYGDTSFFIQHIETQMWLSYRSYETKKRGIGRVEEKQAILLTEGKMDDCLEFSRSQEEEAKTARVIRKCDALFSKFIKILDHVQQLAQAQKSNEFESLIGGQLQDSAAFNQEYDGQAGASSATAAAAAYRQASSMKRRGSVAASAIASAALSGLAPIFSSTIDQQQQQQQQQQAGAAAANSHLYGGGGVGGMGGGARGSISACGAALVDQLSGQQRRLDSALALASSLFPYTSQVEMSKCLEDLIDYFAPPHEGCDHEQEQNRLRALRNRQDLFQEEGILNLILDAIDKINLISGQGLLVLLLGEESSSTWEAITGYFYQLLAAIIKDNHTNCAQFAQSHRLNWLFSRLSSQQASEGTGMLDVLHCVLVDSPEALNMLKESHIKVLISLLEKHGRDPKVLNVLCSLCVSNGVAIRSSQNTITNHLLPGRNLLLQTRLIDEVASMKPNIYIARVDGSAMYHRWYYEVIIDHIELINNLSPHLRIGWANTRGYLPYPGGGQYWGSNGVGDDFYSYGFDGQYLWTAGRPTLVRIPPASTMTRQEVLNNQYYDYQNQQQSILESYANQQRDFVSTTSGAGASQAVDGHGAGGSGSGNTQQQQQHQGTTDGLTSLANIDSFAQSPYLRLQKNDVIGCLIDLSVPTIQFTINGKQIFGFFKNFNVTTGGFFHPVISFSAKVSCRFLFGGNQGELNYRPPAGFSPLVDVLLPGQDVTVEPCFSFGDLAKQTLCGPQITPDSLPQTVMDLIFIPRVIDTKSIELASQLSALRDNLAENMHELWCMSRIEDGWTFGDELNEDTQTHPYIGPFSSLPALGKKYKLDLATQTLKIILGLGFKITTTTGGTTGSGGGNQQSDHNKAGGGGGGRGQPPAPRVKTYRLPQYPYYQALNDYKPAPLDLSNLEVTPKVNHLVELLAENIHNIWAAEKISMKWTYKRRDANNELDSDDYYQGRSCHLLPYKFVDDSIKMKNRQSALETVLTVHAYNYNIEPLGQWDKPPISSNGTSGAGAGAGVTSTASDQASSSPMTPIIQSQDSASGEQSGQQQQQQQHNLLSPTSAAATGGVPGSPASRPVSPSGASSGGAGGGASNQATSANAPDSSSLSGYEVILNNAPEIGPRHYRAEKTYAVTSGRWYYEVEIGSLGQIQVGWANLNFQSSSNLLGCDENSWAFDCHTGRKVHASNYESFGQVTSPGDVIGCMLDLNDRTISYSLNGKLMLDFSGNEMAFACLADSQIASSSSASSASASSSAFLSGTGSGCGNRDSSSSYVPAISLGINQRVRLCFGQDVEQLRYFTDYGLQEGYHPFCVNMHKPITLWYNKREPNFVNLEDLAPNQVNVDVTRIPPGSDSPPALKIAYKQFESQERANWEYLRLSLPVTIDSELIDETDKIAKMQEIQAQQLRLAYSQGNEAASKFGLMSGLYGNLHDSHSAAMRHPARLEQHMLQSGFSMADVKDLQRSYEGTDGPTGSGGANSGGTKYTDHHHHHHFGRGPLQRRQPLIKTRSVDEHKLSNQQTGSGAAAGAAALPSLAVPSFTEAQRIMSEADKLQQLQQQQQQQSGGKTMSILSKRRNTGAFNLLRSGSSMDDISVADQQRQQQAFAGQAAGHHHHHHQHSHDQQQQSGGHVKTNRSSKTTLKSLFGSMKSRSPSEPPRSTAAASSAEAPRLTVPKISIQTNDQYGPPGGGAGAGAGSRSRLTSRAESFSNLSMLGGSGGGSGGSGDSAQSGVSRSIVRRLSRVGLGSGGGQQQQQQQQQQQRQQQLPSQAGVGGGTSGAQTTAAGGAGRPFERVSFDLQQLDAATLELIDEYYYGVRIFPGQEPLHVLCGWVTSQFKHDNLLSLQDIQHTQIIQSTSLLTGQAEICERRECYLLNAGQLYKEVHPTSSNNNMMTTAGGGGGSSSPSSPATATAGGAGGAFGASGLSSGNSTASLSAGGGHHNDHLSVGASASHNAAASSGVASSSSGAGAHASSSGESTTRSNRGMLIGCHVDTSTGVLTFTVDGKPTKYKFNLEPQTKLYPAIFFQATTGDCLQFELARTPLTLPLSAAILSLTSKHTGAQCPPRLKVQTMRPCSWSRVPNVSLRPNALKLSESKKGWSMLAVDPLSLLAVHIPEENRCLDILELIEHEKLLKFHSHSLALYGALCAQGNHKVAHIICSHVDQRQLLYAINSDYLSGNLRLGFANLLIALHLEFHAYGRHLTQNEFIVPISRQLNELYCTSDENNNNDDENLLTVSSLAHSFSRIECVSIRTEMNMSPIGFDLNSIDLTGQTGSGGGGSGGVGGVGGGGAGTSPGAIYVKLLSTPYFPISILKQLVFQALNEAVFKGNLPIRDLPGGSNENLFVPLLKLADKLLLIGCITNQDLNWLLNLIDPETFAQRRSSVNQVTSGVGGGGGAGEPSIADANCLNPQLLSGLSFLAPGANSPSSTWKPTILQQPAIVGVGGADHQQALSGPTAAAAAAGAGATSGQTNGSHCVNTRGLLQMRKLDEHVKLIICHLLHHLLDIQLRHRIESIMAFSVNFVGQLQTDQRRRYEEIKTSNMPSHLTARKTREFRCTPKEQMRYILNFKNSNSDAASDDSLNSSPSSETLRQTLKQLHSSMMKQIKVIIESSSSSSSSDFDAGGDGTTRSDEYYARQRHRDRNARDHDNATLVVSFKKLIRILKVIKATLGGTNSKRNRIDSHLRYQNGQFASIFGHAGQTELKFVKNIVKTIVKWAEESTIENKQLVRQMFHLLLRCYNGVGELIEALNNSYVIGEKSKRDVIDLLQVLSKVRALLAVQMGPAEEEVMRDCLWTLVNNVVFFQHPDLIRILRVHENVMHVMMNTLSKRSRAQSASSSSLSSSSATAATATAALQAQDGSQQIAAAAAAAASVASQQAAQRQRAQSIPGLLNAGPASGQQAGAAAGGAAAAAGQSQTGGQAGGGGGAEVASSEQEDDISKMVVSCCRFLCFFCRSSAKNQKAMFEHLGFLLENSNILLSRPSLRGSTPLDVAYSSLMENHELVLALRESYLEKIAIYLSRCGLQSNQELIDKGYPDVGWDPVEGERYLDFLRFCVWVNGESVEENSNLVIRLLIRRPECLGPALRGEGPGLFAAIKDAIAMADKIHAEQLENKQMELEDSSNNNNEHQNDNSNAGGSGGGDQDGGVGDDAKAGEEGGSGGDNGGGGGGDDDDEINMGAAILNFYCALVDLLGRCAPDLLTIGQGKHESIRALSILKSLVPLQDLKNALALRFSIVNPQCTSLDSNEVPFASIASSFMPNHKQSLVLFLERVYGIENQETFFSLLEEAFLPDMRAATMLERGLQQPPTSAQQQQQQQDQYNSNQVQQDGTGNDGGGGGGESDDSPENEMTLALNRYLGNSAIPLLIRESHYFKSAENYANLLEPTLHTAYRLSKVRILTKGQRESVSDFLIALTREMQPHQLLKLLRKLTVDVAVLNESTTVALRLLTLHYERCSKYYGYSGSAQTSASGVYGTATEEERRLTMVLFTNIFDSLSLMDYDPELFENALPCLNALACALPPDYSLTESREFSATTSASGGASAAAAAASKGKSQTRPNKQQQQQQQHGATSGAGSATDQLQQQQQSQVGGPYVPQPVDTRRVELNLELRQLAQRFSEHYHDAWASRKLDHDWTYGEQYSFKSKTHPRLKPYSLLTRYERDRYIEPIEEALKALLAMGWIVDRAGGGLSLGVGGGGGGGGESGTTAAAGVSRAGSRLDLQSLNSMSSASSLLLMDPNQRRDLLQNYNPQPVDTSNLSLSRELQNLAERSAENAHDLWARKTMEDWLLQMQNPPAGSGSPFALRAPIMLHPLMVPYDLLTDKEKRKNRNRSQELLKYILFEGYKIFRADDLEHQQQQQAQAMSMQRGRINSRAGLDNSASAYASASGVGSAAAVAASSSKRRFAYSILDKLISYTDSVMVKMELLKPSSNFSRRSSFRQSDRDVKFFSKVVLPLIERYFTAHREFFINYYSISSSGSTSANSATGNETGSGANSAGQTAASGAQSGSGGGQQIGHGGGAAAGHNSPTPSGLHSLSGAGGQSAGADDASRAAAAGTSDSYAGSAVNATFGVGCATIKEKEMLAALFCKLASVLRNKLSVIGPDAKIFVRCLQVLTRALDARSLSEQSPDFIKTSMLTYFNKTAQDLSQCVYNLQMKRYNAVRGATMRISSALYHIHLAVLPTLTALFDHLASSESGKYLLMDDIQLASQKILQSLYVLGTRIQLAANHQYSRKELERHRHSYGNCLAAFAAAFPIAFLEPDQLRFNRFSCRHTRRTGQTFTSATNQTTSRASSPSGQQLDDSSNSSHMVDLPMLPRLEELMSLVNKFVLTGKGPSSDANQLRLAPIGMQASGRSAGGGGSGGLGSGGLGSGQNPTGSGSGLAGSGGSGSLGGGGGIASGDVHLSASGVGHSSDSRHAATSGAANRRSRPNAQGGSGGGGGATTRMIPADNDAAIVEVIVPMLCSYLPFWYSQGPDAPLGLQQQQRNLGAGSGSTTVSARQLNELLKDIMHLIRNQVGVDEGNGSFNWMVAVAAHASQIIIESPESSLLSESFLPLSTKICQRAESIYHREELMRGYLKSAAEDTTAIEEKIQEEFHLLVRDIYAFYPLLIKYVDFKKSVWLKQRVGGVGGSGANFQQLTTRTGAAGGSGGKQAQLATTSTTTTRNLVAFLTSGGGGGGGGGGSGDDYDDDELAGYGQDSASLGGLDEEQQSKPEQLLFHQVATVFDIWSNSQYFRREEQNFISLHEIDNMALIMQASNRPGRAFFQKSDPTQSSSGGRKKKRRLSDKRDREREIASSLLVVALKRLLPIGMDLFEGRERELVQHVKERFLKKESPARIEEIVRNQLTQPYKIDPADEFGWQHYLYSRLGAQPAAALAYRHQVMGSGDSAAMDDDYNSKAGTISIKRNGCTTMLQDGADKYQLQQQQQQQQLQNRTIDGRLVARIVDMARVFYGLHIIDHPNLQQKAGRRSCVSTQRRRVVIACFRMTSLHSLPPHRAINIFLRSYCDTWLLDENTGQEKLIEDLTQTFEQAEMKTNADKNVGIARSDPLCQLIMTLSRQATTEHGSGTGSAGGGSSGSTGSGGGAMLVSLDNSPSCGDAGGVDRLYLQFADIFRMSCGGDEEEEEEEEEDGEEQEEGEHDDDGNGDDEGNEDGNGAGNGRDNGDNECQDDGPAGASSSKSSIHEQEIEKQRLLFQQSRLSDRGVAEMILLYISAFSRYQASSSAGSSGVGPGSSSGPGAGSGGGAGSAGNSSHSLSQHTPTILSTLKLGISILRGGNVEVQRRMLKHLKDKKDVGFFTSIQTLMNSCSVLDLDAFERNQKAEALGVRSEGFASFEKNMYDAEFTCKLFRFFQLLCEGHNLEFQNYLRTQAGNTTTVNVVISTVDYLLRLQESIMDFYWHYSSKDVIDPSGTENFIKAITIAKQVFCTLTESIQGPCPQNQQALAHSRLWHAVGGFLFLFAHMQDKLSRNSSQLNLLIELLDLQKEMVIMMLSMLEGNVVNGTIGKQMVETLVESSANVEIILKFFDMFLKLPRLTSSTNFQEYDKPGLGWISQADLRKAMEQHKIYTPEETQYLLSCCEPNHDGMIDYREFIDRFHQPAKDIGFNLAVLLTNLAEHITNEPRLQRFLETASTVLNYFEPYLGRIEIMGSSKRIERVYFEIKESTLDQWAKPQIQESKRAFFYSIVTEGDGKEKLEAFVNFCEDTIFEMQHASNILGEDAEEPPTKADKYPFDAAASSSSSSSSPQSSSPSSSSSSASDSTTSGGGGRGGGGAGGGASSKSGGVGGGGGALSVKSGGGSSQLINQMIWFTLLKNGLWHLFSLISFIFGYFKPTRMRRRWMIFKRMSWAQLLVASLRLTFRLIFGTLKLTYNSIRTVLKFIYRIMIDDSTLLTRTPPPQLPLTGGGGITTTTSIAAEMFATGSGSGKQTAPQASSEQHYRQTAAAATAAVVTTSQQQRVPSAQSGATAAATATTTATTSTATSSVHSIRTEVVTTPSMMRASVADVEPSRQLPPGVQQATSSPTSVGGALGAASLANGKQSGANGYSKDDLLTTTATTTATVTAASGAAATAAAAASVVSATMQTGVDSEQAALMGELEFDPDKLLAGGGVGGGGASGDSATRARKSPSLAARLAKLTNYNQKIISFLARNFYRIKLLALVTAFIINFILLFYKVSIWSAEQLAADIGGGGGELIASGSLLSSVARKTLGELDQSGGGAGSDNKQRDSTSSSPSSSSKLKLDEIEAKIQRGFANYESTYGRKAAAAGGGGGHHDDDDGDSDEADGEDEDFVDVEAGVALKKGATKSDDSIMNKKKKKQDKKSKKVDGAIDDKREELKGKHSKDNADDYKQHQDGVAGKHQDHDHDNNTDDDDNGEHDDDEADDDDGDENDDDDEVDDDDDENDDDDEDGDDDGDEQEDDEDSTELVVMEEKYYYLQPLITFLATVHSIFSLCMLIAYYHLKVPLVIFKREKEIARKLEFDGVYITEEPDSDDWWKGHWDKLVISAESFPVNYWDKFVKKRVREKYREQYDYESLSNLLGMDKHLAIQQQQQRTSNTLTAGPGGQGSGSWSVSVSLMGFLKALLMSKLFSGLVKVDWRYQLWKAGVTLTDQSFQYQLLYLIFSLAGHFNYFFFAAHLLDVAVGFKKLQTILQSVTHNGKQLVLTVMLLTIVVYIYTVIAFNFFRKFYVQGDDSPDHKCHSMMTCFVYHLYQGVRAGGGIGDVIEAPDGDDYEVYRIIFDITFFFFVIVILLAIIQGLIIDAFGELRDQLLTVASDMESNCFICGIGKDVLDKVPRGFDTHVQKEHNLANYMFFLMHLINKPDTDYTGQETYVWELYQRRCWDFFPVGECFRTQSEEEADAKPAKD